MTQPVFWLALSFILYTYLGYPLLLWLTASWLAASEAKPIDDVRVTLMITAHNEELSLEKKLQNALELDYPSDLLQILVVSDGSSDRTDEIARSFSNSGVELLRIPSQKGKTNAQNVGMRISTGEVVVFSDATTFYSRNALSAIVSNYQDPRVGAVSGRYVYIDTRCHSPTLQGAEAYAGYDNTVRSFQSRIHSLTGCCGCIYSIRKDMYTELATDVISDFIQPLHVLRQGYRVVFEPRAVATELSTGSIPQEFNMRVRVIARALHGLATVKELLVPWRYPWISLQLWSHKLLRWLVPIPLVIILVSSALLSNNPFFRVVLGLQLLFYGLAGVSFLFPFHKRLRALSLPLYFCTANSAAVVAFLQILRGQHYTIWKTDRSDLRGN